MPSSCPCVCTAASKACLVGRRAFTLRTNAKGLPRSVQQALARRYAGLFGVYLKHHGTLTRVTLWGVSDGDSWLNNWPVKGRTNYPLLFDRNDRPKLAFDAVIHEARAQ